MVSDNDNSVEDHVADCTSDSGVVAGLGITMGDGVVGARVDVLHQRVARMQGAARREGREPEWEKR